MGVLHIKCHRFLHFDSNDSSERESRLATVASQHNADKDETETERAV